MQEAISRRHLFRREYRPLRSAVSRIVAQADPINLLALGAPGDEYDGEVEAILPRLATARSVEEVRSIVRGEFVRRFGEDVAGPPERYETAAGGIWRAILRYRGLSGS
jgi:hypothetical protein